MKLESLRKIYHIVEMARIEAGEKGNSKKLNDLYDLSDEIKKEIDYENKRISKLITEIRDYEEKIKND